MADGHNTTGGSAHEYFVSLVGHLDGHELHADWNVVGPDNVDDALVSYAVQHAVLDKHHVEAGTLCQVGVSVRQERVGGTPVAGLE